jgi:phosphoglycerate dehydrogenase-like enzyme
LGSPLTIVISGRSLAGWMNWARPTLLEEVKTIAPQADVRVVEANEVDEAVVDADILAAVHLSPGALRRAKRLKWVQSWAAGPNELLYDAMRESPVILTSCKGNGAVPLAEHAIMLMLMLDRDARRLLNAQAERRWDKFRHNELNGRTCGIIGVGHSGTDLALKAKAFHMQVLGLRRQDQPAEHFDRIFTRDGLHEFLASSDFVVVTAALTPGTRGMLGEAEFRAMKPSAYYVCYSRGAIADTAALVRALKEGWIAGAGLDAHAIEPLPAESPFWSMPNVIVTPHIGAASFATPERGNEIFLENLRRFLAGKPLLNVVDKEAGY